MIGKLLETPKMDGGLWLTLAYSGRPALKDKREKTSLNWTVFFLKKIWIQLTMKHTEEGEKQQNIP